MSIWFQLWSEYGVVAEKGLRDPRRTTQLAPRLLTGAIEVMSAGDKFSLMLFAHIYKSTWFLQHQQPTSRALQIWETSHNGIILLVGHP